MCFATWFGTQFWVTFVAGIVQFKNLTRQQFGKLQSKLFPIYFLLGCACNTIMLGSLAFGPSGLAKRQLVVLGELIRSLRGPPHPNTLHACICIRH